MRLFWIIFAVVALAGVGYVVFGGKGNGGSGGSGGRSAPAPREVVQQEGAKAATAREEDVKSAVGGDVAVKDDEARVDEMQAPVDGREGANDAAAGEVVKRSAPDGTKLASVMPSMSGGGSGSMNAPTGLPEGLDMGGGTILGPGMAIDGGVKSGAVDGPPGVVTTGEITTIGTFEVSPGKIERRPDGTITLDDQFTIRGDGSKDRPYEVTWELLTSADKDFDPHSNKKRIPERVALLHGKYVKLGGWIAFPMNMQQPRELLLMLNQWDGCCIGVPPTPYDAIEVTLDAIVEGEDRFTNIGSVTGRMEIKPYVVGDWLVGLYVMELGVMKPQFGGGGA